MRIELKVHPYNQTVVHLNDLKGYSREKPHKVAQLNKTLLFLKAFSPSLEVYPAIRGPSRSKCNGSYMLSQKNYFRITFIFDAVICCSNCSALFENFFSVSAITVIFLRVEYQ